MSKKRRRRRSRRPMDSYLKKTMALGSILPPGGCADVTIRHDDWCGFFKGKQCNCDPDIVVVPLTDERS